ncbi:MAG: hypothetical protein E7774_05560 [Bradyrhizobium sp.]|nr:MAG: hypothetical protein E7774_05560 [Bradyrhizobium sp.]
MRVALNVAAVAACLLAPTLAEAYGRAGPPAPTYIDASRAYLAQGAAPTRHWHSEGRRFAARPSRWRNYGHSFAAAPLRRAPQGYAPIVAAQSSTVFGLRPSGDGRRMTPNTPYAPQQPVYGGDVVAEASRWIGSGKFTGKPGPWCADAVSEWLQRSGHRPLDSRMASAALAYGPRLAGPQVGALAVLGGRYGWASHVGVVSGVEPDGSIRLISGNWGSRVAEAVVSRGAVAAFVAVR